MKKLLFALLILLLPGCDLHYSRPAFDPDTLDTEYFTPLHILQCRNSEHRAVDSCDNCHVPRTAKRRRVFKKPIPQLCYDCHEDYSASNKHLHGPVAVGACLSCHEPHFSIYINLQKVEQPKLCTRCHQPENSCNPQTHPDVSDKLCTQCHNPHAAPKKMLLKD